MRSPGLAQYLPLREPPRAEDWPEGVNPQQEAVALWQFLESRGAKPSIRQVGRLLRSEFKLHFTEGQLRGWLNPFRRDADAVPTQESRTNEALPTQSRRGFVRAVKVPLVSIASCSVPEPSAQKPKSPRAQKLPFDVTFLEQRRVLLNAVWALAQPAIGRSITAEEWRKRNSRSAGDMVKAGVLAATVVAAWHHASDRIGEPVRTMALVQDELGRVDCAALASRQEAQKKAVAAAERVYFKAPPPMAWELPLGSKA